MRKYLKRLLSLVVAVAMIVPNVPVGVFASPSSTPEWEVKRGSSVAFTDLIEKLAPDEDSTTITVTVPVVYNKEGAAVDKTVDVTTKEFPYYVGDVCSADEDAVAFSETGENSLVKSTGSVTGTLVDTKYDELSGAAATAQEAYDKAVEDYNKAETEYNFAVTALATAKDALDIAKSALDNWPSWMPGKDEVQNAYNEALNAYNTEVENLKNKEAAKNSAETAKKAKEEEKDKAWASLKTYVDGLTLQPSNAKYDANDVDWQKASTSYAFNVKVYDKLKVTIVDENDKMTELPEISVSGAKRISGNVYKLYDTETATVNVPNVPKFRFAVTGATGTGNSYSVGPVKEDTVVTVTYTEIGASRINYVNPEHGTIKVSSGTTEYASGSSASAGTVLTVIVTPDKGYEVGSVTVTDEDENPVELDDNNQFTANVKKEDSYTISATVKYIASKISVADNASIQKAALSDGIEAGTSLVKAGTVVTVTPTAVAGVGITGMTVTGTDSKAVNVTDNGDGTYSFTTVSGVDYTVDFTTDDITSSVVLGTAENVTVKVSVDGKGASKDLTTEGITGIIPGTEVTVTVMPNDNYYVDEYKISGDAAITESAVLGVYTLKFDAGTDKVHEVNITAKAPILAAKAEDAKLNAYDIKKMQEGTSSAKTEVEADILAAFDKAEALKAEDVEITYLAASIELSGLGEIPFWLPIDKAITSVDDMAQYIVDYVNKPLVTKQTVTRLLNLFGVDEALAMFHTFGEKESESVMAVFAGNSQLAPKTAERTVNIVDLRAETVTTAQNFSFTYGSNLTHAQLVEYAKVTVAPKEDAEFSWSADDVTFSISDLAEADAGTYNVTVKYDGNYDFKSSASETITVTVNKANAAVKMTEDNVVLYENRAKLLKEGFIYISHLSAKDTNAS